MLFPCQTRQAWIKDTLEAEHCWLGITLLPWKELWDEYSSFCWYRNSWRDLWPGQVSNWARLAFWSFPHPFRCQLFFPSCQNEELSPDSNCLNSPFPNGVLILWIAPCCYWFEFHVFSLVHGQCQQPKLTLRLPVVIQGYTLFLLFI